MREGESLGSLRNIGECRAKARKAFLPVTLLADDFDDSSDSAHCPTSDSETMSALVDREGTPNE